jgi:membrane protease YdiL (CAAX protease family)
MISRGSSWSRPVLVLVLYLGLAAAALVWGSVRGHPNVWRLAPADETHFWAGLLAGATLGLLTVFLSRLVVHRFEWARALHREFRALLSPLTDVEIVVLALASSLGEEIFFRGALMPVAGVWLSSAVFALLHIGPKIRYLPWTAGSFVAGLLFSGLYLWSGDLTGPVVAHFTINFLNLRHVAHYELR